MLQIRRNVFETNSSSMHSLSICGSDNMETISSINDKIIVYPDEFGWQHEYLKNPYRKLQYVVTAIQYYDTISEISMEDSRYFKWLAEMVEEYTGKKLVYQQMKSDWCPSGYIDHQSTDILANFFSEDEKEFKENMKNIVFNAKYTIITNNDNG